MHSGSLTRWLSALLLLSLPAFAQTRVAPLDAVGGVFLSNPATLADQQKSAFMLDSSGKLMVNDALLSSFSAAFPSKGLPVGGNQSGTFTALSLDGSGNLNVNVAAGGASGGTSSTFGAAFPGTGTAAGFKTAGGNMSFALVDGSNNLDVNCVVGCAGGTFNNNADAVATSATNGQSAAWLYGFNGATFDRLRVDGSKNLNVNLSANSFGTLTVGGTVTANAGTNLNTSALALETGGNLATLAGGVSASVYQTNVKNWGGSALGAMANYGTSPGAVLVPGVNAFITNTPAVTGSGTFTVSGTVTANAGTNLNTSALALESGGNLATLAGTVSASKVNVAGTVTANQGGAPWSVSASGNFPATQSTTPWVDNITQIGGVALALGQNTKANSLPVTMALDQPPLASNLSNIGGWPIVQAKPGVQMHGTADGQGNPINSTGGALNVQVQGAVPTVPSCAAGICLSGSASQTSNTATTIIAATAVPAGKTLYITGVMCGRTDAGTTAVFATLSDSASTIVVLPNSGGGGGNNMVFTTPLFVPKGAAFTFTPSSGVSTMYCNAQGYAG